MRARSTLSTLPRSGRMAWVLRSRPSLAVPPAELPSTTKSSLSVGVLLLAVGELAGQRARVERALAADQFLRFAGGLARGGRFDHTADNLFRRAGIFFEIFAELFVDQSRDHAFDFGIAQLGLGLAFELRLAQLDAHDRGQTFAGVVALQAHVLVPEQVVLRAVVVERASQSGLEAGEMGPAFDGVDIVRVAENRLVDRVGPLQRDLDLGALAGALEENYLVQRFVALGQRFDELRDPALVMEFLLPSRSARP